MAEALTREFDWKAADGTKLRIRPVRADDKDLLQAALPRISADNLYRRFFMPVMRLSEAQIKFLTEVDQVDHIAWCAVGPGGELAGVARCVRVPDETDMAEAAILVVDDWQHLGLGTLLLAVLSVCSARQGIRTLRSYALEENTPFLATMRSIGAESHWEYGNVRRIDLPVQVAPDSVPPGGRGDIYRAALTEVRKHLRVPV